MTSKPFSKRLALAAVWLLCTGGLAGCGQTGALYLPSDAPQAAVPAPDSDDSASPDTDDDATSNDAP